MRAASSEKYRVPGTSRGSTLAPLFASCRQTVRRCRRERQADRPSRDALQCAVHGARVVQEVGACPWMAHEELLGEQVALEAIAGAAGGDDVARHVRPASRYGIHVVEGRALDLERPGAVDAPATAVAHRGALYRALVLERKGGAPGGAAWCRPAPATGRTGKGNLRASSASHVTSPGKRRHPAPGEAPGCGVSLGVETAAPEAPRCIGALDGGRHARAARHSAAWNDRLCGCGTRIGLRKR